jgi:hypothetical protein
MVSVVVEERMGVGNKADEAHNMEVELGVHES